MYRAVNNFIAFNSDSKALSKISEKVALGAIRNIDLTGPCIVCGKPGKISSFSRTY